MVKQIGTIYLKPGEKGAAGGLAGQTGATVNVPSTGETYTSEGGWSGGGISGQSASDYLARQQAQRQAEAARTAAEAARIQAQQKVLEQARQQQQLREQYTKININRGTQTNFMTPPPQTNIQSPGTIYPAQTGTSKLKDWKTGQTENIPEVKTYTVKEDYSTRTSTKEEKEQLQDYIKASGYEETALQEAPSATARLYGETKGRVSNLLSQEVMDREATTKLLGGGKVAQFTSGALYGAVGTKGAMLRTGVVYGVSAGLGFAIKDGTSLATAGATRLFGSNVGALTGSAIRTGVTGAGLYYGGTYALEKGTQFYYAPTATEKGEIFGRTTADVGAGFYGFRTGSKVYDFSFQKIKIVEPLRTTLKPSGREYATNVISQGKSKQFSSYNIYGEVKPPTTITTTTRFRKTFGFKPIKVKNLPSRKYLVSTLGDVEYGKSFYAYEFRQGSKIIRPKLLTPEGEQVFTGKINLKGYDPLRRFGFERLAEYQTGGTPVKSGRVGNILGKDSIKQISNIVQTKTMKIKVYPNEVIAKRIGVFGKTKTRSLTFSEARLIKETPTFERYDVRTIFKEVTKPLARATGKTPDLRMDLIIRKEPIVLDDITGVKLIEPANIKKTPFSSTFGTQVQQQKIITLPKPVLPKVRTPLKIITTIQDSSTKIYPSTTSAFAGTGMYEKTEEVISPLNVQSIYDKSIVVPSTTTKQIPTTIQSSELKSALKEITKTQEKQLNKVIQKPMTKMSQKQMNKLMSKQLTKQILKTPPKNPPSKIPNIYPPKKQGEFYFPLFLKGTTLKLKPFKSFTVFGRRFGKWRPIGKARTSLKAIYKGKSWASRTLGASFKISNGKKPLKLPNFYTKKEKGGLVYIEKIGKRLKKGTKEIPEIQFYKGLKGGR